MSSRVTLCAAGTPGYKEKNMSNRGGEVTGSEHGSNANSHGHDSGNNCGPGVSTGVNAAALDAAAVSTSCWEFME
jgi:hypothetical protein